MKIRILVQLENRSYPWAFTGKACQLGRSQSCDLVLDGSECGVVSNHHVRLAFNQRGLGLTDLDSKNGTYLNGKRIFESHALKVGDVFRLGAKGPAIKILEIEQNVVQTHEAGGPVNSANPVAVPPSPFRSVPKPPVLGERPKPNANLPSLPEPAASPTRLMLNKVMARQNYSRIIHICAGVLIATGVTVFLMFAMRSSGNNKIPTRIAKPKDAPKPKRIKQEIYKDGLLHTVWITTANIPGDGGPKGPGSPGIPGDPDEPDGPDQPSRPGRFGGHLPMRMLAGSGTIFNKTKGYVLTNYHVVGGPAATLRIAFPKFDAKGLLIKERKKYQDNNWFVSGKVIHHSKKLDLAVIKLDIPVPRQYTEVTFAKKSPVVGEPVHVIGGHPRMRDNVMWVFTHGNVRSVAPEKISFRDLLSAGKRTVEGNLFRSDILKNLVSDGAGVVNREGELIGIDLGSDIGEGNRVHLDIADVKTFLQSHNLLPQ